MKLRIRINRAVRKVAEKLFPIPEDSSEFYGFCECCDTMLMVDNPMNTDSEGVLFCKQCWDGLMKSEVHK